MPKTVIEQFKMRGSNLINNGLSSALDSLLEGSRPHQNLTVSEMFGDTIQGEGIWTGHPATFLRLTGCTLDCVWCDTAEVWRKGDIYSFLDIVSLLGHAGLINKLREGQHLVLTGGSPLKQQADLARFIQYFIDTFGFKPYIEVENECVLSPYPELAKFVDCWNNSPKLANSGMKARARYKMSILKETAQLPNSWFKFVVSADEDWQEIQGDYLDQGLFTKDQVILMPCGMTQEELAISRPIVADMAVKYGVLFSDRLHITIWNKMTGV